MNLDQLLLDLADYKISEGDWYVFDQKRNDLTRLLDANEFAWVMVRYPDGLYEIPARIIGPSYSKPSDVDFEIMDVKKTTNGFEYFVKKDVAYLFSVYKDNIRNVRPVYSCMSLVDNIIQYIRESRRLKFIFTNCHAFATGIPIHVFKDSNENMSYVTIVADADGINHNKLVHILISALAEIIPISYESENDISNE